MNRDNPEFLRQLWLNWRPSLLGWSLGLVALVLALPMALFAAPRWPSTLIMTSMIGLWLAAVVYGSLLAARSLSEEAQHHTWDWQRLSALSPWQMAWGKLLGATVPAWMYVLWFAMACMAITTAWHIPALKTTHIIAQALLWGLALQTWSMNLVLLSWGQQDRPLHHKRRFILPLLLILFVLRPLAGDLYDSLQGEHSSTSTWWGLPMGNLGHSYLAGLMTLGLGLLALWRQLCTRLDVRTLPWAWPLGLAMLGTYMAGYDTDGWIAWFSCTAWLALMATAGIALLHMEQHLRAWRQVQWSLSRQRWQEAWQALPLWPVSWLLGLLCSLPVLLMSSGSGSDAVGPLPAYISLQLLRDCLLLTGFALLAGKLRAPVVSFILAWLILNLVIPLLALGVAGRTGALLMQPALALWMSSVESISSSLQAMHMAHWISLGLQLLAALGWAVYVFRDRVLGFARNQA